MAEQVPGAYIGRENDKAPITYIMPQPQSSDSEEDVDDGVSVAFSKVSQGSNAGNLGFSPIPFDLLKDHCDVINYWLRENIPGIGISQFPEDVINEGGKQLFETIEFLTKKNYGAALKFKPEEKLAVKVAKQSKTYSTLIKTLMEQGAYLNHIRPEFLLAFQELGYFLRSEKVENAHPVTEKLKENQYRYLSMLSWSIMFTQIIKLFYLARVNHQKLRSMSIDQEFYDFPRSYLMGSTVYSQSEITLLKWLEGVRFNIQSEKKNLLNFDQDLRSGINFASVLH